MHKVKFTFPYPQWPILRQTPNSSGIWENYQFHINDNSITDCDYWIVFEGVLISEEVKCNKNNTIFIGGEGSATGSYSSDFLNQFGHVITCQERINHPSKTLFHTANPWFVGKTFDELMQILIVEKTRNISLICSDKQFTDGHKRRYDFCMELKDYFGNDIDLFGRGIKDFDDKWDVLSSYKYSVAIENLVEKNWFTEKLYDCFLSHTFPFYYGCPNIDEYFFSKPYLGIDLNDIDKSKKVIYNTLNNPGHYENSLPILIEAKLKYLNYYNIFPLVVNFIEKNLRDSSFEKQLIAISKNQITPTKKTFWNKYFNLNLISKFIIQKSK